MDNIDAKRRGTDSLSTGSMVDIDAKRSMSVFAMKGQYGQH